MKTSTIRAISNTTLSIVILVCIIFIYFSQPLFLRWVDLRIYDLLLYYNVDEKPSPALAIIDIDEKSLDKYGQWPWPRYRMAQLIKILTKNQPAAIGVDILQAEADQSSPSTLQKNLKDIFNVDISINNIPSLLQDNDKLLADVYKQAPLVAGSFLQIHKDNVSHSTNKSNEKEDVNFIIQRLPGAIDHKDEIITAHNIILPIDIIAKFTPVGYINAAPDIDGILRSAPLIMQQDNKLYPSLALRTLMRALNTKNIILRIGADGLENIKISSYNIPVSPQGLFHILYRGPKEIYPYFSVLDIMEGRVKSEELQEKILFIGTSATGLLDIRATPFDPIYPGVESHATIVDNILNNRNIIIPAWAPAMQIISILITGFICALIFSLTKPAVYLFVALVLSSVSIGSSQFLFAKGFFFSPLYSLFTLINIAVGLLILRFWQIEKQKIVLQQAFSNYVSPEVVSQIVEKGGNVLQGQSKEVSILFTDIRGFTTLSENLQPTQVVCLLNDYLTPMTALILKNKGTVDKFIGDAIMPFWNAPLDVPNHPTKAIQTAIEMMNTLDILNIELKNKYDIELAIGAGIHTGMVHVGNMGSAELLDYTCIGDTVNISARLESLSSQYGRAIITSEYTKNICLQDNDNIFNFMEIDTITVKGKSKPIKIFTILSTREQDSNAIEFSNFKEALSFYQLGNFKKAEKVFMQLHEANPSSKLFFLYYERCINLIRIPPHNWDGVWKFNTK